MLKDTDDPWIRQFYLIARQAYLRQNLHKTVGAVMKCHIFLS